MVCIGDGADVSDAMFDLGLLLHATSARAVENTNASEQIFFMITRRLFLNLWWPEPLSKGIP